MVLRSREDPDVRVDDLTKSRRFLSPECEVARIALIARRFPATPCARTRLDSHNRADNLTLNIHRAGTAEQESTSCVRRLCRPANATVARAAKFKRSRGARARDAGVPTHARLAVYTARSYVALRHIAHRVSVPPRNQCRESSFSKRAVSARTHMSRREIKSSAREATVRVTTRAARIPSCVRRGRSSAAAVTACVPASSSSSSSSPASPSCPLSSSLSSLLPMSVPCVSVRVR